MTISVEDTPEAREALRHALALERTIPVSEIFGPTLEGEGPWAGQPTYFLRIGGCDYHCEWCDTDQAVLAEKVRDLPRLTQGEIWDRLRAWALEHRGPELLAISGGNPGLYDLGSIVKWWQWEGPNHKVLVETQGSRWMQWFSEVNLLTISPKPPSSGLDTPTSMRNFHTFMEKVDDAAEGWRTTLHGSDLFMRDRWQAILKVVVFDEDDYAFARDVHRSYPNIPFHLSTGTAMGGLSGRWVPPAIPGLTEDERDNFRQAREHQDVNWTPASYIDSPAHLLRRYRWLAERAMNDPAMADAKVQVQLHCLLWGITTKGV